MAEQGLETYHGNCHCGAFKFSVRLPELKQVLACNCSICSKKGYLWALPSSNDLFVVEKGDGTLKDYQFGKKTMSHKFCPNCGTPVMGQRHVEGPSIAVNVRTFRDFDEEKLEIKPYDGAGLEPHYTPPNGPEESDLNGSTKCYRGSCHCGKVSYDLRSEALEDIGVLSCNCSICSRNADLWVYPSEKDVELRGGDHLTVYRFGRKVGGHAFCSTCGVPIMNQFEHPGGKELESMVGKLPVNARVIDGIDLKALKVTKGDGKNMMGPKYEV
ncbi:hypothetical protein HO173_009117 [Letharia columbiana]|uniref:CENP-V/GFA domain-containing protein n=1 Tax=Letharia columbiana TaxID=112416 RepID=A0A8H6FQ98_9LECA|nr:uncharacterized protein HO173_009117 [Letharia columbiana]KAF6232678.1 hypothetical protein HO173_009117 [Letharia columbiana]